MNIIVGATGQVGSYLISELKSSGYPVRAVVREPTELKAKTIEAKAANLFDAEQLTKAFKGGTTVFVLTPESPASSDIIGETKQIVANYRKAIQEARIRRVVGLSCIGAHVEGSTGNILMSRILEQGFEGLEVEQVFVRPSYYFSNWLGYLETAQTYGVLPSFFPDDLHLDMNSPVDLAKFIAHVMSTITSSESKKIYELTGPQKYSARDVARVFSALLHKNVAVQSIPNAQWKETLLSVGFTENTARNLMDMTQAVIYHKTVPERPGDALKLPTTLEVYMEEQLKIQSMTR
ncbi:uncharacterized protein YbjT (DUF2867 family) [Pontibacter mucosus]|uniref:Uncharacterized protein YbjT (DUF2867 family) n=1 Tax=Pontibacter mucosus TaxID=1649266 RepID=A0A2T5YED3_9BACT|nr:NmrA family NAD(P)-binding protein [Pontibacter mucosus]PTX15072.1 uncharacterized protein YbjT (DUF2867 family) [Pontibacter mucosus]